MKEAYLYEKLDNNKVRCNLCSHRCIIKDKHRGICGVRENRSGILVTLVYDKVITMHCDPVEKKPLFHFLPKSRAFSIATVGCNFRCLFCQNADISQMPSDLNHIAGEDIPPEIIVQKAIETGSSSIAYTYTEPTVYFELAFDTARLAASKGLKNLFISNGYMTRACLETMQPYLHAANIDLKAFSKAFYRDYCKASLDPVLETIATLTEMGIWTEVTTLLIPGLNDSETELRELAKFLFNLDPNIPWHISRFYPTYKLLDIPPTSPATIHRAKEIGLEVGLRYIYTGNIPGDEGEKTFCHNCGKLLIDRYGFNVITNNIVNDSCPVCGVKIPGVWS